MGIKKINKWEKAVVFLLNIDGWDLEWCGDGFTRYDAKGKTPKAIVPVHLYGMPSKMHELMAIASQYEIPVIEDAAEAISDFFGDIGEALETAWDDVRGFFDSERSSGS